ncbi:MAG: 50S ribosomal protein L30 [Deltaproteobacteria bacterium]|nr:50S ribosomal protein L30 [Deltaproteobacteria bacterium]
MSKSILVKQIKSTTQSNPQQKSTLKSIGLRGMNSVIYRKDTRALRGMLHVVQHMITAEQVEASKNPRGDTKKTSRVGYKIG